MREIRDLRLEWTEPGTQCVFNSSITLVEPGVLMWYYCNERKSLALAANWSKVEHTAEFEHNELLET